MPLFKVFVTYETEIVVEADDFFAAAEVARDNAKTVISDDYSLIPLARVRNEIKTAEQLPEGWQVKCLPYGSDGRHSIKDILDNQ